MAVSVWLVHGFQEKEKKFTGNIASVFCGSFEAIPAPIRLQGCFDAA